MIPEKQAERYDLTALASHPSGTQAGGNASPRQRTRGGVPAKAGTEKGPSHERGETERAGTVWHPPGRLTNARWAAYVGAVPREALSALGELRKTIEPAALAKKLITVLMDEDEARQE